MPAADRECSRALLHALHECTDHAQRSTLREELVLLHLPLARHIARRFTSSSQTPEDLVQVAVIGLLKAIDAFDPAHGTELSTFAVPTMLGELRQHLRDRTWAVHAPRSAKERAHQVSHATETLTGTLGRSPTVQEIAAHLDIDISEALTGLQVARGYAAASLDAHDADSEWSGSALADVLGTDDPGIDAVEAHHTVRALMATLEQRERELLVLRFWHGMSQSQIAARLGMSQMHVSRLISATLSRLRTRALAY